MLTSSKLEQRMEKIKGKLDAFRNKLKEDLAAASA